jgi:hypothetical protein
MLLQFRQWGQEIMQENQHTHYSPGFCGGSLPTTDREGFVEGFSL